MSPDATCNYAEFGVYGGKQCYQRLDTNYYIWWEVAETRWVISAVLGTPGLDYWENNALPITGIYTPGGTATGDATVILGEHP